jgi:general L-amino acid transport system permease protein
VSATFRGDSREVCAAGGACWPFVNARAGQFIYGFYPEDQRWRVDLAFVILLAAFVPLFLKGFTQKLSYAVGLVAIYPIVAYVLFAGGVLGLEHVETSNWGGLFLTLVIAGVGIASSLPLGIVLALGRRSSMPVVRMLSVCFIELVRGVPLITVLFMASVMLPLFLPPGVNFDKLLRALVGFSLFSAAYMAEVVRGGLQAIPKGQYEAAQAVGLGYWKMMGLVVLPQALKIVIPGIVNTFIGLFKDTSLVLIIGLFDFLNTVQAGLSDPKWIGLSLEGYIFAGLVYWVFCFAMSRYSMALERKLDTGHRKN